MDYMPFVYQRSGEDSYRMDIKSVLQSLVVASVIGVVVMYGTQRILTVELASIKDDIKDVKHSIRDIRKDIYVIPNR